MGTKRDRSWQDVVPADAIPAFKWFYERLKIELVEIVPVFKGQFDLQVASSWSGTSWISYYGNPPDLIMNIVSLATGCDPISVGDDDESRKRRFIDLIVNLQGKTALVPPGSEQERSVIDHVLPIYGPLKLSMYVLLNELLCVVKYRQPVSQLLEQAKMGDEDAVIKLTTLDHSFIAEPPALDYLRVATLAGNRAFLRRLAGSLTRPPLHMNLSQYSDEIFILLCWYLGFATVKVEQFGFFLQEAGMTRFNSTSSLQRKLTRLGISAKEK